MIKLLDTAVAGHAVMAVFMHLVIANQAKFQLG
jgi:hypothetical protein